MGMLLSSTVTGFLSVLVFSVWFLVNLLQAFFFVIFWGWSKNTFRRINATLARWFFLVSSPLYTRYKVELYTDSETLKFLGKEKAIVMPNHRYTSDFLTILTLAQHFQCALPVVSKKSMKHMPAVGWNSWFGESVFLSRDWSKDQKALKSYFGSFKYWNRPFWLLYFLEGTRFTSEKLLDAQRFAISKGIRVPNNVLVPRIKGFALAVKCMRSCLPAIYDVTISMPKGYRRPSVMSVVRGGFCTFKVEIKRCPIDEVPKEEDDIAKWCRDRFAIKDELLEKFYADGTFSNEKCYEIKPKKIWPIFILWSTLYILGMWWTFQWKGLAFLAIWWFMMTMLCNIIRFRESRNPNPIEGFDDAKSGKAY